MEAMIFGGVDPGGTQRTPVVGAALRPLKG